MKKSIKHLFFVVFLNVGLACNQSDNPAKQNTQATAAVKPSMADSLSRFYRTLSPLESPYLNKARARYFTTQASSQGGNQQFMLQMRAAYESLLAGDTQKAISEFERLKAILDKMNNPANNAVIHQLNQYLAVAYLRLGEQENCQHNHSPASCIIPLEKSAIHKLPEGSSKAIQYINAVLEKTPNDENFIYLLNLAYMTLGKSNSEIQASYRRKLVSDEKKLIPKFENKASVIGLDDYRLSGGVIIDDFNNDFLPDIVLSSWSQEHPLKIFFNRGNGRFEPAQIPALDAITGGLNINHTDFNNDGYLDIYVMRGGWLPKGPHNSLLVNNGDETFTDVSFQSGLNSARPTQTSAWADFNNDGFVDLFIGNESSSAGVYPCELYINNKGKAFEEKAQELNAALVSYCKGVAVADYDNDGDQDIFLSTLRGSNKLLQNQLTETGVLSFVDNSAAIGAGQQMESFPCWFFDVNNDGWQDLFVSAYSLSNYNNFAADWSSYVNTNSFRSQNPKLLINDQKGQFKDATTEYGLNSPSFTMGSNYGDINNDNYPDFYLATGEPDYKALVPNRMFLNREGKAFSEVSSQGGFAHIQKGHGVSIADIDNDGDEDVYCVLGGAYEGDIFYNALFENPLESKQWIKLKLVGQESNRAAIGAKVRFECIKNNKTKSYYKWISSSSSFGENPFLINFHIRNGEQLKAIHINWPSGALQVVSDWETNKVLIVEEGNDTPEITASPASKIPAAGTHAHHHSN